MRLAHCAAHSGDDIGDSDHTCLVIRHDDGRRATPRELWAEIERLRAEVAAERERLRELVEQLCACHDEPTCPAVTLAREWLAGSHVDASGVAEVDK